MRLNPNRITRLFIVLGTFLVLYRMLVTMGFYGIR